MGRYICRLCGRKVTVNRSSHLRWEHGIDGYKGAVKEYFLSPLDLGIPLKKFEEFPEGAEVA